MIYKCINRFLEDTYIGRDPFSPDPKPLILGSNCVVCNIPVCVSQVCLVCNLCSFFSIYLSISLGIYLIVFFDLHVLHICQSLWAIIYFQSCSVFYTKRYCVECFKQNISKFPQELVRVSTTL